MHETWQYHDNNVTYHEHRNMTNRHGKYEQSAQE